MAHAIKIPLSSPDITAKERVAVEAVLKTPTLSLGSKLSEFEARLARQAKRKYAVAVNSGTSALHLIVRALGIGKGDEVITTPFSFVASANCILYEGAKPVFCDIEEDTLNIDVSQIEKKITKATKAILAVDVFGHPAEWEEIGAIAKKHRLKVIEDSAEALGSEYKGKRCGSFGSASIFSFYPNKQITTGEGGAVLTDSKTVAELCRSMANQGRRIKGGSWLEHERLGYNYRLTELQAALGSAQLSRLGEILRKRAAAASLYSRKLKAIPDIELPYTAPHAKRSWFVYVVKLAKGYTEKQRDKLIQKLGKRGIQCGNYFKPIHLQPFYKTELGYKRGMFLVTESVGSRTIALPFFTNIAERQIDVVMHNLKRELAKLKA